MIPQVNTIHTQRSQFHVIEIYCIQGYFRGSVIFVIFALEQKREFNIAANISNDFTENIFVYDLSGNGMQQMNLLHCSSLNFIKLINYFVILCSIIISVSLIEIQCTS